MKYWNWDILMIFLNDMLIFRFNAKNVPTLNRNIVREYSNKRPHLCLLTFVSFSFSFFSSVHLCNNSIQKHLRPSQQRHRGIPVDNMWLDEDFKAFLASQGKAAQWETVVVPGMKKAVIHTLQTAQDLMESRKNTFELYGADFMLGRMRSVCMLLYTFKIMNRAVSSPSNETNIFWVP